MCLSHVHMFTCVWCCWRTSLTTGCSTPMIGWLCKDFVTLTTSLLEFLWSYIGLYLSINFEEVPGKQFFKSQTNKKLFFLPCTDQYFVLWVCSIRVVKFTTKIEGRKKIRVAEIRLQKPENAFLWAVTALTCLLLPLLNTHYYHSSRDDLSLWIF